jgi:hypothetical protein
MGYRDSLKHGYRLSSLKVDIIPPALRLHSSEVQAKGHSKSLKTQCRRTLDATPITRKTSPY